MDRYSSRFSAGPCKRSIANGAPFDKNSSGSSWGSIQVKINRTPRSKSANDFRARDDLATARAQLELLQEALSTAQRVIEQTRSRAEQSRLEAELRATSDLANVKAELRSVKEEASVAREATEHFRAGVAKSRRNAKYRLRVTALVMLVAALIKLAWVAAQPPPSAPAVPLPPPPIASIPIPIAAPLAETRISPGNLQLSRALNRLGDAFRAFPEDQRDVVAEINRKHPGNSMACPLAWNDEGVPSLFVGGKAPLSVVEELNRCASELEELSVEKQSAK